MSKLEQDILEAVIEIPGIAVLLLFGSRAKRKARPDSDLDVAVLPAVNTSGDDESRFRLRLLKQIAVALADFAPEGRVDVVLLDEAQDTLRQAVMEHGTMVLCRDPAAWRALRVATMKEYGDREGAQRMFRLALRQRLLEGRPGGRKARVVESLERARRLHH